MYEIKATCTTQEDAEKIKNNLFNMGIESHYEYRGIWRKNNCDHPKPI